MTSMEADRAYIVKIRSGNPARVITVCGKTTSTARTIALQGGAGIMNYIGTCYPVSIDFNSSNLAPLLSGGIAVYDVNADIIKENYNNILSTAYKNSLDGLFHSASLYRFTPGRGYIVSKKQAGDVVWTYPKQY
jgi:hypothetical protein